MQRYTAGNLDARNINSVITIKYRGRTHIGAIATIEHTEDRTEIFLAHGEDVISIPSELPVTVSLDGLANSSLYTLKAVEGLREMFADRHAFENNPRVKRSPRLAAV